MDYFEIAKRSYDMLERNLATCEDFEWYNTFAADCQQGIEKFMKAGIETFSGEGIDEHIFKSHKLGRMAEIINSHFEDLIDVRTAAWIEDFYFDARYPGDDFVVVSKDTALELFEATKNISEKLIEVYNNQKSSEKTSFFGEDSSDKED